MRERTQLQWWAVLPVLPPIVGFLVAEALIGLLGKVPIGAMTPVYKPTVWHEASGRMQLLAMMMLYYLFSIGVVGKFLADAKTLFGADARKKLAAAYGLCLLTGAVVVFGALGGVLPRTQDLMDAQLFRDALARASWFGADRLWGPGAFEIIVWGNNLVTAIAVPAFIAGGVSCLARFPDATEEETWIYQSERLKTYIYLSAGLLVIGVLYLKAWTQYPGYLLDEKPAAAYTALVNSYAMFTGVEYSIVLSAFALPVAMILSWRADDLAARIVRREEKLFLPPPKLPYAAKLKAVREREKLFITSQDVLKTLAALLAPFITGTVASLTSVLG